MKRNTMKYLLLAATALLPCGAFAQGIVPSTGVVVTGAVTSVNGATGDVSVAARGANGDITSLTAIQSMTMTGVAGSQTINLHGGIATSATGRYNQNFITSTLNGVVSGTSDHASTCSCFSQINVVTTIGQNAVWTSELYGGSFGVATNADAANSVTADIVGLSSGVDQEYVWGSRIYGGSSGTTLGVNGSTPHMLGYEADVFNYSATGAAYRTGFNAWSGGTHNATTLDAAYVAMCTGGGGASLGACWGNLIALEDGGGTLNHPLQSTASLIMSEGAQTIANAFDFHNMTITGNIIVTPTVTWSGTGRLLLPSARFNGTLSSGNMNALNAQLGISGDVSTDTTLCGSMVSGTKCAHVWISDGLNTGGSITDGYIPILNGAGPMYTLPAATSSTLGGVKPDGTTIANTAGAISVAYGTSGATATVGNDSRFTGLAYLGTAQTYTAAQRGAQLGLTVSGSTFTPNFDTTQHFVITLVHGTCPCTIANPSTTPVAGQSGVFTIIQSGSGNELVTWGNQYKFTGGNAPTLSTVASAKDDFGYYDYSSSEVHVGSGLFNVH